MDYLPAYFRAATFRDRATPTSDAIRMKQFILTLVAVMVGGFIALLAYDRFVVAPRDAATADRAKAEALVAAQAVAPFDPGRARSEAKTVAEEVDASVQRSVENARQSMDAQAAEMDQRALVADAVQRATMFRVALTEYYQANGRWPGDADEAGLPSPSEMRGGAVRTVALDAQGAITIALDERFGAGSVIVLKPMRMRPRASSTGIAK